MVGVLFQQGNLIFAPPQIALFLILPKMLRITHIRFSDSIGCNIFFLGGDTVSLNMSDLLVHLFLSITGAFK